MKQKKGASVLLLLQTFNLLGEDLLLLLHGQLVRVVHSALRRVLHSRALSLCRHRGRPGAQRRRDRVAAALPNLPTFALWSWTRTHTVEWSAKVVDFRLWLRNCDHAQKTHTECFANIQRMAPLRRAAEKTTRCRTHTHNQTRRYTSRSLTSNTEHP